MKRSTLSLLLALGVFFSLNAFAADKVDCFKMNFKNGKIKKKSKKECKGKWHTTEDAAVNAAKEKCTKKGAKKKNWEWKDGDGKDKKGRCVKTKNMFGKDKYKLGNNIDSLAGDILNLCYLKGFSKKDKRNAKKCYKAAKKFRKLHAKSCRKAAKAEAKERDKNIGSKLKALFSKKKSKDGESCKDYGKKMLKNLVDEYKEAGFEFKHSIGKLKL